MKINTTELERVKELRAFFARVPEEKVRMSIYGRDLNPNGDNETFSCMTAGCLAGWAGVYKPFNALGFRMEYDGDEGRNVPKFEGHTKAKAFSEFFGMKLETALWLTEPYLYGEDGDGRATKKRVLQRLDLVINGDQRVPHTNSEIEDDCPSVLL